MISGEPRSADVAGEGLLGAAAHLHHVCRLQEDRAGEGYRGGSGRGVGDGGEGGRRGGVIYLGG
jgi:hypothetical protein